MNSNQNNFVGIREIAQIANVSTATVSRVINHPEQCSPKTREKVEKIIKEYNYIPNETIKNIFSKTSNTIAVFIYDIQNPFYTQLIMELNTLCFNNHYTLLICDTENNTEKEQAYLKFCIAKRCEGLILTEGFSNDLFKELSIPFVFLDRYNYPENSFVTSDNYESVRKVVNYLYNLGHRKIAFVGPEGNYCSVKPRYQGYIDELTEKQLNILPEYIYRKDHRLDTKLGKNALQHFLSLPDMPTAVVCANDMIALGLINEAKVMNIEIPEKLSICGFDHTLDDFMHVPLTTVEQDIPKLAEALFHAVTTPSDQPTQTIIKTKFIPGHTCAKPEEK